jgi:cupin superfamily acireductone dioxygenase involved in methionine salvage
MNKEDINNCINYKKAMVFKNFFNLNFCWEDFFKLYKDTFENKNLIRSSFGTLTIENTEEYTNKLNKLILVLSEAHPGRFIHALSIIHFITKYSEHIDKIDDKTALNFRNFFFEKNIHKVPEKINKENFKGEIHYDDVDGFYIQCDGSVIWRVYYEDKIDEYTLNKGDVIFIPKFIKHSVDSLEPRNAISFAFRDAMV